MKDGRKTTMSIKLNKRFLSAAAIFTIFSVTSTLTADITIDAANTKKIKNVSIKIGKKAVTKKTYSLKKGRTATLKVTVTPKKAKKSVSYKSSKKNIATVSRKGIIKAKKKGTAKITVSVRGKDKKIKKAWMKVKITDSAAKGANKPENNTSTGSQNPPSSTDPSTGSTPPSGNNPTEPTTYSIKTVDANISDGQNTVYGKIYMPDKEGKFPAIIMCHGYNGSHADFLSECSYFAQHGYIACTIDFCGGSGRSKSSGKSTDMTIFTEKSNLLATYNYVKNLSNVDSSQIFLFGGSQGGLVTALATEEVADGVKGMILYFPAFNIPDDWRVMHPNVDKIPDVIDFWGLKLGKIFATSIHDFDPFQHVGSFSKNVLILYGAQDAIVKRQYIDRAKAAYQHAELIVYPNEGHGFTPATGIKAREEVLQFMKKQ